MTVSHYLLNIHYFGNLCYQTCLLLSVFNLFIVFFFIFVSLVVSVVITVSLFVSVVITVSLLVSSLIPYLGFVFLFGFLMKVSLT